MNTINNYKNSPPFLPMALFGVSFLLSACEDFVKIDPPRTDLVKSTVFANDATANAAMIDVYYQMTNNGFMSGKQAGFSSVASFSSDEQINYSTQRYQEFNDNELVPSNELVLNLWSDLYNSIYKSNSVLEGVSNSTGISENLRKQLEGEAKFIRALCHFYLVNLYGNVPLILSTDYQINSAIPRTDKDEVYNQIIIDLKDAQNFLLEDYSFSNNERTRANKGIATALLARTYLYIKDWVKAEAEATKIIGDTSMYSLVSDLNLVFRKNSTESIWQFHTTYIPNDFFTFRVTSTGPNTGAFRSEFTDHFETGDNRRTAWVRSRTNRGIQYFFPGKYKSANSAEDYSTVIRLAEMYLLRAEAKAQQHKITEAQEDLNVIRTRAGLGDTQANEQTSLLLAIEQERKFELFTEWGHRWLDLKRTGRADAILLSVKGNTWQPTDALYPIPEYQILNDNTMRNSQNPGY